MGISFFNKPTYKKFNLPSRYYDEEKSDFERRLRRWERLQEQEESGEPAYNREEFKAELKMRWQLQRESGNYFNRHYTNRRRMIVLALIVAGLLWVIYLIGKKYMV